MATPIEVRDSVFTAPHCIGIYRSAEKLTNQWHCKCANCGRELDHKEKEYYTLNRQTLVFDPLCRECYSKMLTRSLADSNKNPQYASKAMTILE